MLNPTVGIKELSVADKGFEMIEHDLESAKSILWKIEPAGTTPLSKRVSETRDILQTMLPSLTAEGKRVAIILATDGLPSDNRGMSDELEKVEFIESLRSLEELPVWVVIRLCTGEFIFITFKFWDTMKYSFE